MCIGGEEDTLGLFIKKGKAKKGEEI